MCVCRSGEVGIARRKSSTGSISKSRGTSFTAYEEIARGGAFR